MSSDSAEFYQLKGLIQSENWSQALEILEQPSALAMGGEQANGLLAHAVSMRGGEAIVDALIAVGAGVNSRSMSGETMIESALLAIAGTSRPSTPLLKLLLSGADANAPLSTGFRPLHFVASRGDVRLVHLLKSYGADPYLDSVDPDPIDPFMAARLSGREDEVIEALHAEPRQA